LDTSDSSISPAPQPIEEDEQIDEINTVKPSIPEPAVVSEPALKPAPVPKQPPRAAMTMNLVKAKNDEDDRKAAEEQRKKKAALLAKMKQLEDEEDVTSPLMTSSPLVTSPLVTKTTPVVPPIKKQITNDDLDSILGISTKSTVNGSMTSQPSFLTSPSMTSSAATKPPINQVDNLNLGKPSNSELSFGGYAPSISNQNSRRKGRPHVTDSSTNGSDSDTPLFDLNKPQGSNKKPDLLQQLFGEPTQPKVTSSNKPAARKPAAVNSGYPWEKNVIASPTQDNNWSKPPTATRNSLIMSPLVKSRSLINEDDIEELAL